MTVPGPPAPGRQPSAPVEAIELFSELLAQLDGEFAPDAFYGRLCDAITRLTAMERAVIFSYDGALHRVRAVGAHGLDLQLFKDVHITLEAAPVAQRALAEDRVIELTGDPGAELPAVFADLVVGRRLVCTPMAASGRWVGVVLTDRLATGPPLGADERHLLWTLGKTAALASVARISTAQNEKARQLQQRIDMAREIHDGVIQRLFGVSLALAQGGAVPEPDRKRCEQEVQLALSDLRVALQRPLGREARPTRTTLPEELWRLNAEHRDLGISLHPSSVPVPESLEPLAQSVLAEAVRNARKHARPTRVDVRMYSRDGTFVMEVVNDGVVQGRTPGMGLGMGLRLTAFEALQQGGVLEFGARDDDRWQIRLLVPHDDAV